MVSKRQILTRLGCCVLAMVSLVDAFSSAVNDRLTSAPRGFRTNAGPLFMAPKTMDLEELKLQLIEYLAKRKDVGADEKAKEYVC
jgi:hypothetical protein